MRTTLMLIACATLTLAGCLTPEPDTPRPGAPGPAPEPPMTTGSNGTIWFPPPSGLAGAVVRVPIVVAEPSTRFDGVFTKAWSPGPEGISDASSAMMRLVGPGDEVLGELMLPWNGPRSGILNATGLAAGEHAIVFTLYGASDGSSAGHHVTYGYTLGLS